MRRFLALGLALVCSAAFGQSVPAPGSLWSASGLYDASHKLAVGGISYRVHTFSAVLGIRDFSLDLYSFAGGTTDGRGVAAFALGKCFPLATGAWAFAAAGIDQAVGASHPGFCLQAGITVRF